MACMVDRDCRPLGEQAFIQSDLDTNIYLRLPPGCELVFSEIVGLNKAVYCVKRSDRA